MLLKKMAKGHEQFLRVSDPPSAERLVNIINDHGADFFSTMWLLQKIVSLSRGCDCWNMLMLPNSSHFIFTESAKSDAVFQRDHDVLPLSVPFDMTRVIQRLISVETLGPAQR
jgi:hypothetical protein